MTWYGLGMTRYYGKPEPLPYVDLDDLVLMARELGAGTFSAGQLHGWYASNVEKVGRKPVTKVRFGLALKEAGWSSSTKYLDGTMVRCWTVDKGWLSEQPSAE